MPGFCLSRNTYHFFFDKKISSISTDHNNCPFHFEDRSTNKSAMRKLCNPLSLREIQSQSLFINLRTPFWSLKACLDGGGKEGEWRGVE